jgi:hypothetical protein
MHDRKSPESSPRSIALRSTCFAQAQGIHPCMPVERMRSTQGWIYHGPENKCDPHLNGGPGKQITLRPATARYLAVLCLEER